MPPILSEEESALDPYTLLSLTSTADEKDVRRSYKKLSLKYHPDKNSTPEAAIMFRQISLSLEILLDTAKRNHLDTKLEGDRKKKARYAEMDKKRKAMVDALNQREEEAKRAKVEAVDRKRREAVEEEIKDQGKRMLEEAQRRAAAAAVAQSARPKPEDGFHPSRNGESSNGHSASHNGANGGCRTQQPPITPLDLTLTLSLAATTSSDPTALSSQLSQLYGPISHVHLRPSPADDKVNKKKKGPKGIVEFAAGNWGGCWACWKDHSDQGEAKISGMKAKWAIGRTPDWVEWASQTQSSVPGDMDGGPRRHIPPSRDPPAPSTALPPAFESAPDFGGTTMAELLSKHQKQKEAEKAEKAQRAQDESMTLLKMRQMERQRLEEQIRREEELEA